MLFKSAYFLCELDGEVDFREEVTKIFARLLRFARDSLSKCSLSLSVSFLFSTSASREKYINIILKMEEMLKSWFPNVKLQEHPLTVTQTEEAAPTKKLKVKLKKKEAVV